MKLTSCLILTMTLTAGLLPSCSSSEEQSEQPQTTTEESKVTEEETNKSGSITITVLIEKEITDVWEIASDLNNLEDYFIGVKDAKCTSEEVSRNGATRSCEFLDGGMIDEVVTQWEEGKSLTLRASLRTDTTNPMDKGWFYKYIDGSYSLKQVGDSTEATISMKWEYLDDIEVTEALEQRVNSEFEFANNSVAQGLKNYVESGVALTDDDREAFVKKMMETE